MDTMLYETVGMYQYLFVHNDRGDLETVYTYRYLFVHNEHGDLGAIFAGVEDLMSLVQRTVKSLHFNCTKYLPIFILQPRYKSVTYIGSVATLLQPQSLRPSIV